MFIPIAVRRLRYLADECRKAQFDAVDPLTIKELLHFETLFLARAIDLERNQQKTTGEVRLSLIAIDGVDLDQVSVADRGATAVNER